MSEDEYEEPVEESLTRAQAAKRLGMAPESVDRLVRSGKLRRVGSGRAAPISLASIEEYQRGADMTSVEHVLTEQRRTIAILVQQVDRMTAQNVSIMEAAQKGHRESNEMLLSMVKTLSKSLNSRDEELTKIRDQFGEFQLRVEEQKAIEQDIQQKKENAKKTLEFLQSIGMHVANKMLEGSARKDEMLAVWGKLSREELDTIREGFEADERMAPYVAMIDAELKRREEKQNE